MNRKNANKLVLTSAFVLSWLSCVVASAEPPTDSPKLQNGEYHTGVVLLYQDGEFDVADPDKIDYDERNYVLIHGAHSKTGSKKTSEIAQAIREQDPDGNIFAVDWSCFANFNEARIEDIITEQAQAFIADILAAFIVETLTDEDMSEAYEEVVQEHIELLATRIVANLLPIEQTLYIPLTAKRANSLLFGEKGTQWEFTTNDEKATFVSLGLDPQNTHIIGHSHGAHVAGMICRYCKEENDVLVDRLTALEPSPAQTHISEENKEGKGWNASVARYVDVYKTSLFFSSDKLYGDFNFEARMSEHPLNQIETAGESPEEIFPILLTGFKTELSLHSVVIDVFITLVKDEDLLNSEPDPQKTWIIEEY